MAQSCTHRDTIDESSMPSSTYGCSDCLATGGRWVHLRMCSSCGRVGCCNSSPGKHATAHHEQDQSPADPLLRAARGLVLLLPRWAHVRAA